MQYIMIRCGECGQAIEILAGSKSYGCIHCGHMETGSVGNSPISVGVGLGQNEQELSSANKVSETASEIEIGMDESRLDEAENYCLQATFILHSLQANMSVYGSNSAISGAQPADVDLALKYMNRCLEIWPNNPKYLNLKALFLIEGKGEKAEGLALMEKASRLAPNDINIQNNLEKSKQDSCFIASAVFGSQSDYNVVALRDWRDRRLNRSSVGRFLVKLYYTVSPSVSKFVNKSRKLKLVIRYGLEKFVRYILP